ncbi:hypothetical protein [uncultured Rikenella sp.]|uniref:hypothetical protein n=1 Tax=uncultured Rikenella sp. TaxID=368003 RepID=UPI002625BB6E|nr:hypothetical protein [uncultured Rikenella sp.]
MTYKSNDFIDKYKPKPVSAGGATPFGRCGPSGFERRGCSQIVNNRFITCLYMAENRAKFRGQDVDNGSKSDNNLLKNGFHSAGHKKTVADASE